MREYNGIYSSRSQEIAVSNFKNNHIVRNQEEDQRKQKLEKSEITFRIIFIG